MAYRISVFQSPLFYIILFLILGLVASYFIFFTCTFRKKKFEFDFEKGLKQKMCINNFIRKKKINDLELNLFKNLKSKDEKKIENNVFSNNFLNDLFKNK